MLYGSPPTPVAGCFAAKGELAKAILPLERNGVGDKSGHPMWASLAAAAILTPDGDALAHDYHSGEVYPGSVAVLTSETPMTVTSCTEQPYTIQSGNNRSEIAKRFYGNASGSSENRSGQWN